jgi:hypothetical protein
MLASFLTWNNNSRFSIQKTEKAPSLPARVIELENFAIHFADQEK